MSALAWVELTLLARGHTIQSLVQRWQILFDDQPDRPEVNAQVAMHDHVAEACEITPWDVRLRALDLARQALAWFGQRLQVADDRILYQARSLEPGALSVGVREDPVQAVAHVRQQHPVCLGAWAHSGKALAITRSRSAGCKLASVTTSTRRPNKS